jgi:hypothetical protein
VGRLVINNAMTVNGAFEAPSPEEWLVLDPDSNNVSLEQFLVADAMVLAARPTRGWPRCGPSWPERGLQRRLLRGPHRWARAPPAERLAAFYAAMVDLLERHSTWRWGPRRASAASPPAPPGSGAPTSTRCWPRPASRPPVATPWSRCCWRRWRRPRRRTRSPRPESCREGRPGTQGRSASACPASKWYAPCGCSATWRYRSLTLVSSSIASTVALPVLRLV